MRGGRGFRSGWVVGGTLLPFFSLSSRRRGQLVDWWDEEFLWRGWTKEGSRSGNLTLDLI